MRRAFVTGAGVLGIVACASSSPPPPVTVSESCKDAPPQPQKCPPAFLPTADAGVDAGVDASTSEETPTNEKRTEKKGRGACSWEQECVLTTYQGCCGATCEPYASAVQDLAKRQTSDGCANAKVKCPVPPKCGKSALRATGAVCRDGTCTAVFERNDPGY